MKYLSITEYAKRENISTKAVYARIKKGTVFSTIKDGKKYVLEEEKDCSSEQQKITELSKEIKELKSRKKPTENAIDITPYQTEIQDLKNELEKVKSQKQKVITKEVKNTNKKSYYIYISYTIIITLILIGISISYMVKKHHRNNTQTINLKAGTHIYDSTDDTNITLKKDYTFLPLYTETKIHFLVGNTDYYYVKTK